jgi:DNA anti-recombination protein RmuC
MKMSDQTEHVKELIETSPRITEEARLLVEDTRKLTAQLQNTLKEIHKMKSK